MTDEQVEKIIKRNMNLQMNLAGIRADFEEASQRQPLTDEEILSIARGHYNPYQRAEISFARAVEAAHGIKGEA